MTQPMAGENRAVRLLLDKSVLCLSALLVLAVLPLRPELLSLTNLDILLMSMVLLFVLALGQGFVLITAGIDLSIPAVMSLCSVAGASVMAEGAPLHGAPLAVPVAVMVMLLVGLCTGAAQGLAVSVLGMPAFLVSLSALIFIGGIAVWYTQSARITVPDQFIALWYGRWFGVPLPVIMAGVLGAVAHCALSYTVFGRRLYAVGYDRDVAEKAGLRTRRLLLAVYTISGLTAGLGGMLLLAQLAAVSPNLGQGRELDVIAAAVLGGTSLFGGRGTAWGSVLGALLVETVRNGLNVVDADPYIYPVITGGIIFLAVFLDSMRHQRTARLAQKRMRGSAPKAAPNS